MAVWIFSIPSSRLTREYQRICERGIARGVVGIERERALSLEHRGLVLSLGSEQVRRDPVSEWRRIHHRLVELVFGFVGSPEERLSETLHPAVVPALPIDGRERRMRERVVRIELASASRNKAPPWPGRPAYAVGTGPSPGERRRRPPGWRSAGLRLASGLLRRQRDRECRNDVVGNGVLNREHVGDRAIVAIGPEMPTGRGIDELRIDPHLPPRPAHAALENVLHTELATDLLDVDGSTLVREARVAGDHEETRDLRQIRNQVFGHAVNEVFLLRVVAHIRERQDHERRFVRKRNLDVLSATARFILGPSTAAANARPQTEGDQDAQCGRSRPNARRRSVFAPARVGLGLRLGNRLARSDAHGIGSHRLADAL